MHDRSSDRHADPGLPRIASRRALIAGAAGFLVAVGSTAGFLGQDAAARRVRNRRRNRNQNRRKETSISIPGQPGQPGNDGEP